MTRPESHPLSPAVPAAVHDTPTDSTLVFRALARHPGRTAFRSDHLDLTYAQTAGLIARLQRVLERHGVGPGSRTAILSANRPESWCCSVANIALGGATTMLHPLGAREGQTAQIEELGAQVVIVDAANHAPRGAELQADHPGATFLTLGPADYGTDLLAAAAAEPECAPINRSDPRQPAHYNFTGGTTGRPKGVMRTAGGAGRITLAVMADFDLPEAPRYLAVAPISHVAGTKITPTLLKGGTIHLMNGFDPAKVLATIEAERISMTLLVPTMIYALLDHPDMATRDVSSLEMVLYGAAPMSPTRLGEAIEKFGPVFAQLYGQTECYPIAVLPVADHDVSRPELLSACGFAVSSATVRLLDADGNDVPQGMPGEISVQAPQVMEGYYERPELTLETLGDGWLRTGDVAVRDAEGRLYIVDRRKDMIVSGGFNVYPREVEDALAEHPDVAMAAVIGVPDEKWGEAVCAYVVPKSGATLDTAALAAMVKAKKGGVHTPKSFHVVEALPQTALGKIDKVALRAPHWEGRERKVG